MKPYKHAYFKIDDSIFELELDKYEEQYLWEDAGLNFKIIDDKIICDCDWLKLNENSVKGIEILERKITIPLLTNEQLKDCVDLLTDEQRIELFSNYCKECGRKDPHCRCWDDD
jgi:hypothetical protein